MDYELYHDKSQVGGYWHGILLVPTQGKSKLLGYLHAARAHTHFDGVLGIKHIKSGTKHTTALMLGFKLPLPP